MSPTVRSTRGKPNSRAVTRWSIHGICSPVNYARCSANAKTCQRSVGATVRWDTEKSLNDWDFALNTHPDSRDAHRPSQLSLHVGSRNT